MARVRLTTLVLAVLVLSASACGGGLSAEEKAAARKVQLDRLASVIREEENKAATKRRAAALRQCDGQIGPLLTALRDLDASLDIGLSFSDYGDEVRKARIAYNHISADDLGFACINAASEAEKALNAYVEAYNIWNDCFDNLDCTTDSIEPKLQRHWSKASAAVGEAQVQRDLIDDKDGLALPEELESDLRLVLVRLRVIPKTANAAKSGIYGVAVEVLCKGADVPADRKLACTELKAVLEDGVQDEEVDDLDDAVTQLNITLGVTPPDEG